MATRTAGAFSYATVNKYKVGTSATSAVVAGATDNIVSQVIKDDLGDKKILVGVNVIVAFDNVGAELDVEGSTDGTNWVALAEATSDILEDATGVKLYLVDLSSIRAPYYRLKVNNDGAAINTTGTLKFIYATEVEKSLVASL